MFLVDRQGGLYRGSWSGNPPRSHRRVANRARRFAADVLQLEDRFLLSRAREPVDMPGSTITKAQFEANAVLYYFAQPRQAPGPLKVITFYNNTNRTVYPYLRDVNSRTATKDPNDRTPIYDPYDDWNQEYRGYIGYSIGEKNYLGLRPNQHITVPVPLVFWDGGRMGVATDGSDMFPKPGKPNPLNYDPNAIRYVGPAFKNPQNDGIVMWYHAKTPAAPKNDAPDQLLEMTFRDPYLATLPTADKIPNSEKSFQLINYDVSYVDSMLMPIAMAAVNVPIPDQTKPPKDRTIKPYGWIGSDLTFPRMQEFLDGFSSPGPQNGLGRYWDRKGYDKYFNPDEDFAGVKVPAGQNLIAQSPLNDVRSAFNQNRYALVSGGRGNIEYFSGGFTQDKSTTLKVVRKDVLDNLEPGMTVVSQGDDGKDLQPGTVIDRVDEARGEVILSKPALKTATLNVYTFKRPVSDYVVSKLTDLWYGWAKYYLDLTNGTPTQDLQGDVTAGLRVLTLEKVPSGLVPGMTVTGAGLPDGTTIMSIKGKQVSLSKVATANKSDKTYHFIEPQAIPMSDEVKPLVLKFDAARADLAAKFSREVYGVMSAMSTIPVDQKSKASLSSQLMLNVLGCNIGFIPHVPIGSTIEADIRDATKSILRGVYDFEKVPEYTGRVRNWYPDPAVGTPGADVDGKDADFSVYNLNPFVWFVHVRLGLSGYGFSVDDDVADVGANGADQLAVAIGGLDGLPNKHEWTWGAPFGPVNGIGLAKNAVVDKKDVGTIEGLPTEVLGQLNNFDSKTGPGALVRGPGVPDGTRVFAVDWGHRRVILTNLVTPQGSAENYRFGDPITQARLRASRRR